MKRSFLLLTLSSSLGLLPSCTTLVRSDPQRPTPQVETAPPDAPLFGRNGSRTTIQTESATSTTAASTETTTPRVDPNRDVTDPDASITSDRITASTTTTTTSGPRNATTGGDTTASTTTTAPEIEERYAIPHPSDPDLVINPFNPNGPPLRVRNLSNGRPDYQSNERVLPDSSRPNQRVIVP